MASGHATERIKKKMTEKIPTSTQHPRQDAGTFFPQKGGEGVRSSPCPAHFFSPNNHPTNTPLVQRDPEETAPASEPTAPAPTPSPALGAPTSTPDFNPIAKLVRSQLSDSALRGHLKTLGSTLHSLAIADTAEGTEPGERLTALSISRVFSDSAAAILRDPALTHLRSEIIRISEDNPEAILAAGLATIALLQLAGVGIPLSISPDIPLGHGVTLSGAIDMGTTTEAQFRRIQSAVRLTRDYFGASVSAEIRSVPESDAGEAGHLVGEATGEIRIGTERTYLSGRMIMSTEGRVLLEGAVATELFAPFSTAEGRSRSFQLSTALRYERPPGEEGALTLRPGLSADFRFDGSQRLRIGASAIISPTTGLEGFEGSLEYTNGRYFLRFDGNMDGIPAARSMAPDSELRIQGFFGITFP